MRLLIGNHLQSVLDAPKEKISLYQLGADRLLHPATLTKSLEGVNRLTRTQIILTTASNQLLRLRKEFDLTNAAAPKLYVVTGYSNATETAVCVDLPLHGVDVGDRRIIEVFAPDEGRKFQEKVTPGFHVASARARLN